MTRKDYVLIARAMADARPIAVTEGLQRRDETWSLNTKGAVHAWQSTVAILGRALQADNPRFDAKRFVTACNA